MIGQIPKPKTGLEKLSVKDLLTELDAAGIDEIVSKVVNRKQRIDNNKMAVAVSIVVEIFERLISLNKKPDAEREKETCEAISSYQVWHIINLVRLLFKRTNIADSKAFRQCKKIWL